jgi:hypothetical protein
MFLRRLFLAGLLLVAVETPVFGEGFRCPKNDRLVEAGFSMKKVIKICGPPKTREDLITSNCDECDRYKVGELWIYDFGPYTLEIVLTFMGERLTKVDQGGYGT